MEAGENLQHMPQRPAWGLRASRPFWMAHFFGRRVTIKPPSDRSSSKGVPSLEDRDAHDPLTGWDFKETPRRNSLRTGRHFDLLHGALDRLVLLNPITLKGRREVKNATVLPALLWRHFLTGGSTGEAMPLVQRQGLTSRGRRWVPLCPTKKGTSRR